jgi:glycosyltransferase involved in cell wall biosynthesis
MCSRLGLAADQIEVVPNGIDLASYVAAPEPPVVPTIGYLARMVREKGLELLVDAFLVLTGELKDGTARLKIGGAMTAGDEPLIAALKSRLERAGVASRVEWAPNLTLEQKSAFLRSLTLFSVPAVYAEAFGLYVVEAMASSVAVVQPEASAFPEIIGRDGGGVCVPPRDPRALAVAWQRLLADPAQCRALGAAGRLSVEKHFNARTMAERFIQSAGRLGKSSAATPSSPTSA